MKFQISTKIVFSSLENYQKIYISNLNFVLGGAIPPPPLAPPPGPPEEEAVVVGGKGTKGKGSGGQGGGKPAAKQPPPGFAQAPARVQTSSTVAAEISEQLDRDRATIQATMAQHGHQAAHPAHPHGSQYYNIERYQARQMELLARQRAEQQHVHAAALRETYMRDPATAAAAAAAYPGAPHPAHLPGGRRKICTNKIN